MSPKSTPAGRANFAVKQQNNNERRQLGKHGKQTMKTIMTLQQANALIQRADGLFRRAALAWERGNNSGNSEALTRGEAQCDAIRTRAEELLEPLGISCDYPGLYPSLTVKGRTYYTVESAVSAALEGGAL